MAKAIRVKGKNLARTPGVNPTLVLSSTVGPVVATAYHFSVLLELDNVLKALPTEAHSTIKGSKLAHHRLRAIQDDPDGSLCEFGEKAIALLPTIAKDLKADCDKYIATPWLSDYKDVLPFITAHIAEVVAEHETPTLPLLGLVLLWAFLEKRNALTNIVPWFISYASIPAITRDDILNRLANMHYEEYITRLSADELFEFLTSENERARIKAKNKVRLELAGELDEA